MEDKSNEIDAIPELLRLLDLQGAVVTIDAMGCHKAIAAQIQAQGGNYLLALKGNHPLLHADAQRLFAEEAALAEMHPARAETVEKDHGRIETRRCTALPAEALLGGLREIGRLARRAKRRLRAKPPRTCRWRSPKRGAALLPEQPAR